METAVEKQPGIMSPKQLKHNGTESSDPSTKVDPLAQTPACLLTQE